MLKETKDKSGSPQRGLVTLSAHGMSDHGMKRAYFPGVTDIVVVTDPAQVRAISND